MTTQHTAILAEAEFNELRDFLAKQKQLHDGFNIVEAHGYMAGLICGPEVLHLSTWLPIIFNGDVEYTSNEQEQRIISYLCRMYNNTAKHLHSTEVFPQLYYPAHPANSESGTDFQAIKEWTRAYIDAIMDDDWVRITDFQMLTFPIVISSEDDDDETLIEIAEERKTSIEEVRHHFLKFLTQSVQQLYGYFTQVKHHADISMLEEQADDGEEAIHDCHDCGTVH